MRKYMKIGIVIYLQFMIPVYADDSQSSTCVTEHGFTICGDHLEEALKPDQYAERVEKDEHNGFTKSETNIHKSNEEIERIRAGIPVTLKTVDSAAKVQKQEDRKETDIVSLKSKSNHQFALSVADTLLLFAKLLMK